MAGVEARYKALFSRGPGAERIAFFSDAVFAIAMTILVVDIRVPEGATSVVEALAAEWTSYLGYIISFIVIAVAWVSHHRRFRVIVAHDNGLIWINLALLFLIASLPFPTAILSEFAPDSLAVTIYAAAVALIMLVQLAQWVYVWRRGLVAASVDAGINRYIVWAFMPTIVVMLASIPVAYLFGGHIAMLFWLAQIPLSPIIGAVLNRRIDREVGDLPLPSPTSDGEVAAEPPQG